MAIEKSLVSGSMTMLILKLLSEKDMYLILRGGWTRWLLKEHWFQEVWQCL